MDRHEENPHHISFSIPDRDHERIPELVYRTFPPGQPLTLYTPTVSGTMHRWKDGQRDRRHYGMLRADRTACSAVRSSEICGLFWKGAGHLPLDIFPRTSPPDNNSPCGHFPRPFTRLKTSRVQLSFHFVGSLHWQTGSRGGGMSYVGRNVRRKLMSLSQLS